jgi:hypothetical protein
MRDGLRIRKRATVQNGNFEIIELDVRVVDPNAVERREQVLNGGDPYAAVAHQSRGISNPSDRSNIRPKLEIIEIDAPENDAFACRCRKDSNRCALTL